MTIPTYEDPAEVRAGLEAARAQAAREGKRVAVIFGAGWCGDSRALDAALEHRLVTPIIEPTYVLLKVSVGNRDRNLDLMEEYGMDVWNGIPAVVVLEPDGTLVAAQRDGEFRNARSMSTAEIVTFFHSHAPAGKLP